MSSAAFLSNLSLSFGVPSLKKTSFLAIRRGLKISSVCCTFKTEFDKYNIKWVAPPKKRFYDKTRTGDLSSLQPLPYDDFPPLYQKSEVLKSADPLVQRIFSNKFIGRRAATRNLLKETIESVAKHEYDKTSMEARIAWYTHRIRNLSENFNSGNKNSTGTVILNELIFKRRKLLGQLRERDYKKFEWLLEKLNLQFKPHPAIGFYERIERKKSLRNLVKLHCDKILDGKWKQYEDQLETEKKDFLRQKVETFKWARQEQIDCKLEPTVSEEDILKAEKVLEDFLKEWEAKEKLKPKKKIRA